jgi:hypothetical protein
MSVLNSVSSFSPTAFFKDWPIPAIALATGVSIGGAFTAIGDLERTINDIYKSNTDVQKGILDRVKIVFTAWSVTLVMASAGLCFRHSGFGISAVVSSGLGILAVASSGVAIAVMLNIKWEVQKSSSSFKGDTQAKLARAVKRVFEIAIPAIATLTLTLVLDSLTSVKRI